MKKYVIATIKPWNIELFKKRLGNKKNFTLISDPKKITYDNLKRINPDIVFFPHWSWIIPKEVWSNFKCIVFHLTDLPYGRGGTPLQNIILDGKKTSKMSAIRVGEGLDDGDIYFKEKFSLDGSAQEIYTRASNIVFKKMIPRLIKEDIKPKKQKGKVVVFKRRTSEQSKIIDFESLEKLYNHIRMLDADEYPRAFIDVGKFKIEFKNACFDKKTKKLKVDTNIYEK